MSNNNNTNKKQLLITVGSTKFDKLINNIDNDKFYDLLDSYKFTDLIIQRGKGDYIPINYKEKYENKKYTNLKNITVSVYLNNFESYIKESDFIITHCGAGTLLEGLKNKRNLLAVVNVDLMDNHQIELAEQLEKDKYIYMCRDSKNIVADLENNLKQNINTKLKEYPEFNYDIIPNLIYDMMDIK